MLSPLADLAPTRAPRAPAGPRNFVLIACMKRAYHSLMPRSSRPSSRPSVLMRALAAVFAAIATFLLIRAAALVVLDVDVVPSPPPAVAMAGCNRLEARSATDKILSGAQLVCIATSMFFDVDEVARACEAADLIRDNPFLRDVIVDLVAQREAAKRSGFAWAAGVDGGARPAGMAASADGGRR